MIKRVLFASLLCVLLVAPAATAHSKKGKVKVKIERYDASPTEAGAGNFVGTVSSNDSACGRRHTVTVYLRKKGRDKKIGQGNTFPGSLGSSYIIHSTKTKAGTYYAKSDPTTSCKAGKSKGFKLKKSDLSP